MSQPAARHHEVKLKETGFSPTSVQAKKGDIVWWKWTGTKSVTGLEQVSFRLNKKIRYSKMIKRVLISVFKKLPILELVSV